MSSLEDLYREVILDHYRAPRNRGELISPPAIISEGKNPICGDELTLFLQVQDNKITDIKLSGSGCSISTASASMMSVAIKDKDLDQARELIRSFKELMTIHESNLESNDMPSQKPEESLELGELEALTGVVKFPVRIKCATLAFNTLENAINNAQGLAKTSVISTE